MFLSLVLQEYAPHWSMTHLMAMHTDFYLQHQCPTSGLQFHHMGPDQYMKLAFLNDLQQAKAPTPWPAFQNKQTACQTLSSTINDASFNAARSAQFFSSANATLARCHSSPPTPTVFRNSFDTLSITLDNEEDQFKALRTFSSLPTSAAPSHVSTPPQHIKTSVRNTRCSIPSPSHTHHLPSNHPPLLEQDPAFLHEEITISHGHHKWHSFQFLPPEKLWQMSPIIKSFP